MPNTIIDDPWAAWLHGLSIGDLQLMQLAEQAMAQTTPDDA